MLNILPAEKKSQIKKEQVYITIRSASVLVISFFILADLFLYGARIIVTKWYKQLQSEQTTITVAPEDETRIENDLNALSLTMNEITKIQAEYYNPVAVMVPVMNLFPDGSTVEELNIDIESHTITANGFTRDRESFIALQEQLNTSPLLSSVDFEVTSFTKKENIPFEFNALIDYENLEIN